MLQTLLGKRKGPKDVLEEQQKKINIRLLEDFEKRLAQAGDFNQLQKLQNEMGSRHPRINFSDEQQFLLKDLLEYHRSRLRDIYLDSIQREINARKTEEDISAYWNNLKEEIYTYRPYVGKEYELLIAQIVDQRLNELKALTFITLGE